MAYVHKLLAAMAPAEQISVGFLLTVTTKENGAGARPSPLVGRRVPRGQIVQGQLSHRRFEAFQALKGGLTALVSVWDFSSQRLGDMVPALLAEVVRREKDDCSPRCADGTAR